MRITNVGAVRRDYQKYRKDVLKRNKKNLPVHVEDFLDYSTGTDVKSFMEFVIEKIKKGEE